MDGSEVLAGIGERLNKESRAVKNWRNLAYRLKIPHEVYGAFDTSKAKAKSSTKEMFKWLAQQRPNLTVDDLLAALKKIDRFDVVDLVREETNFGEFQIKEARLISSLLSKIGQNYVQMAPACLHLHVPAFKNVSLTYVTSYMMRPFMTSMPRRPCMLESNRPSHHTENITTYYSQMLFRFYSRGQYYQH